MLTDCATCQGHGIDCDRTKPKCTNCSQSNRRCQWHNLKLSWPRANDGRRAVVSKACLSFPTQGRISSDARFIHTTHWDVELHYKLANSVPGRSLSSLDLSTCWNPSELEILDSDLLEYFSFVACESLATFGQDTAKLGRLLLRLGLEGKTAASAALLQALIAFSSLHRYGLQSQAVEAKITALGNLAQGSIEPSSGAIGAIQHICTSMLLCSFEVHQACCTSDPWTQYLDGVKAVITASSIKALLQFSPDVVILLDWLHYHDVLARFSLLHLRNEGAPERTFTSTEHLCPQISNLPPPILSMLNLLSQVCDTVSSATSPKTKDNEYDRKNFVKVLDWRIRSLPIPKVTEGDDDVTLVMKLYQLAMLLYLNRNFEGLINQPIRMQQHIEQVFAILPRLSFCKQQFPICIIGCESRTDEQRAVILDVISRTETMSSSRSFNHCKRILLASWAQDDLGGWNDMSYHSRLASIMGLAKIVPAFV